jgi:type I restriction-modification system DNA methylase subunit
MTSIKQRDELQSTIWKIANEVRGAVDGWDFKQFVLGALFYRFISENFTNFIEGGDESVNYANMSDDVITPVIKDDATRTKGYFIYPQWSDLLPDDRRTYYNRIIQFTSHSTLSNEAVAEPTEAEKQTVGFLLKHLIDNKYWKEDLQ